MVSELCIVGGGAVGSVLAYYAYRSGFTNIPVYYASRETVELVTSAGGVVVEDRVRGETTLVPIVPRLSETPLDRCRFVFNAVKAYSVRESLDLVKKILEPGGVVVMLQNGFGSLELAEEVIVEGKVAGGVVYFGAERVSRNRVVYHGGNTVIAGCRKIPCPELSRLAQALKAGGLDFRVVDNIDYYRWLKLALNAVVNSITAITRSRNKILLESEAVELANLILGEVVEAARLSGYDLDKDRLLEHVVKSARLVQDNVPSTLQDVMRGSQTEIDYLNGYVVKILGEKAPVNKTITLLVKLIEKARARGYEVQPTAL